MYEQKPKQVGIIPYVVIGTQETACNYVSGPGLIEIYFLLVRFHKVTGADPLTKRMGYRSL